MARRRPEMRARIAAFFAGKPRQAMTAPAEHVTAMHLRRHEVL